MLFINNGNSIHKNDNVLRISFVSSSKGREESGFTLCFKCAQTQLLDCSAKSCLCLAMLHVWFQVHLACINLIHSDKCEFIVYTPYLLAKITVREPAETYAKGKNALVPWIGRRFRESKESNFTRASRRTSERIFLSLYAVTVSHGCACP